MGIKEIFYGMFIFILIGAIVCGFIFLCVWGYMCSPMGKEQARIEQEWRQKVNDCVLNEQCRPDCKLILYRDRQIHNQKVQDNRQASVMTGAMVGGMVGASIGGR